MNRIRLAACAALLLPLPGLSAASAGGQYEAQVAPPLRLVPIMHCEMMPFGSDWGIWVRNGATNVTLPQGTQLAWTTAGGLSGSFTVGSGGLAGGHAILVDVAPSAQNCSARVV